MAQQITMMQADPELLMWVMAAHALRFGWQHLHAEITVEGEAEPRQAPADTFGPADTQAFFGERGLYQQRYTAQTAVDVREADAALVDIQSWVRARFADELKKPAVKLRGEFAAEADRKKAEQKRIAIEVEFAGRELDVTVG